MKLSSMAEIIRMPKLSDAIKEGVLLRWLKKEGDALQSGDILAEVKTKEGVMKLKNHEEGELLHIVIKEGEKVPLNGLIAIVGTKNDDLSARRSSEQSAATNRMASSDLQYSKAEASAPRKEASMSSYPSDLSYVDRVRAAADRIRELLPYQPSYAVVLGTGAERLADLLSDQKSISYEEIPYLLPTTSPSHHAQLRLGVLDNVPVLVLEGRYHYYEGYDMSEVTFPIRLLGAMGVETLLMTNAAGGLLPGMQKSELVVLSDHINLQPQSPLRGPNLDEYGPRFPDMSAPYNEDLRALARVAAHRNDIPLREGIYVGVEGPQLETPAEYEYLRRIGGSIVGMSTIPEVIVARHMGIRCCVCSVVSDLCYPGALEVIDVPKVLAAVAAAEPHLVTLLRDIIKEDAAKR